MQTKSLLFLIIILLAVIAISLSTSVLEGFEKPPTTKPVQSATAKEQETKQKKQPDPPRPKVAGHIGGAVDKANTAKSAGSAVVKGMR